MFVRRFALPLLPIAFMFIVTNVIVAQDKIEYCEPSPAVKADLKQVDTVSNEDLPFKVRRERQIGLLQELLKKYPNDFHVQRRYLETRNGAFFVEIVRI